MTGETEARWSGRDLVKTTEPGRHTLEVARPQGGVGGTAGGRAWPCRAAQRGIPLLGGPRLSPRSTAAPQQSCRRPHPDAPGGSISEKAFCVTDLLNPLLPPPWGPSGSAHLPATPPGQPQHPPTNQANKGQDSLRLPGLGPSAARWETRSKEGFR